MAEVVMPRLSDSMEEGTIISWLKATGDEVQRGEEIVEIETDKANMTYEADASGTLAIVAQEGATLPIGAVIATIGAPGEVPSGGTAPSSEQAQAADAQVAEEETGAAGLGAEPAGAGTAAGGAAAGAGVPAGGAGAGGGEDAGNGRIKASPVARRLARELGVDLAAIAGSGPGGRIVKADVEASAQGAPAAAAPVPADQAPAPSAAAGVVGAPAPVPTTPAAPAGPGAPAAPGGPAAPAAGAPVPPPVVSGDAGSGKGETTVRELSRLQQTIARRMAESKATVPEFTLTTEVDMEAAVALRAQLKAAAGESPAPSFNDMVVKAAALALREFPRANGAYKDGKFELYSRVNVGVAVAAQDALIVPTIFDADRKSLSAIGRDARALAARVRAGQITPPELSGGTFTVSNLGMYGVTEFTAVINPPQAAILAVGALRDIPVVKDGAVVAGKRMNMTLACDHRILYGADAAEFLARVRALLEAPFSLAF